MQLLFDSKKGKKKCKQCKKKCIFKTKPLRRLVSCLKIAVKNHNVALINVKSVYRLKRQKMKTRQ